MAVDPFTQHLDRNDDVHLLLGLFGCVCRDGRVATALLLRPSFEDGNLVTLNRKREADDGEALLVDEARARSPDVLLHDLTRLPYEHWREDTAKVFSLFTVRVLDCNAEDWIPNFETCAGHAC